MNALGGWADQGQLVLVSALAIALVIGAVVTVPRSSYWRDLPRRDLLLLGGCLALALGIRLAAKSFPSSSFLESGQMHGISHRWAAGFSAVLRFLSLFGDVNVASIARLNVVISLATIGALFVFVDTYFEDRFAAFSAAAVLSLQPVSARFASSDSSAVLQAFCLVAGVTFLARWNRSPELEVGPRADALRTGARGLLLQGVGWLVLGANVRYESLVYLAAGAFIVVGGGGWPRRGRTIDLVLGGLFGMVFLIYPILRARLDASGGIFELSPLGFVGAFPLGLRSPAAVVVVAFLGLFAATLARFRAAVAFLFALVIVSLPGWFFNKECNDMGYRYALPNMAFWAAFAGYGCSTGRDLILRAVRRHRGSDGAPRAEAPRGIPRLEAGVVVILATLAALPHRAFLELMWTPALEYEFVVAELKAIEDECLIVGPDSDQQGRGLRFSGHLSAEAGKRHRWSRVDSPEVLAGKIEPCTIYYQATTCFAYEATMEPWNRDWTGAERPVCRRIGELYDLDPIATTTIPARGYQCEAHTLDPLPVGFYRMRPKDASPKPPAPAGQGGPP